MSNYIFVTVGDCNSDPKIEVVVFVDKITTITDESAELRSACCYNAVINLVNGGRVRTQETIEELMERISDVPPEEYEPNDYTLCPYCGYTHHEDETHECRK